MQKTANFDPTLLSRSFIRRQEINSSQGQMALHGGLSNDVSIRSVIQLQLHLARQINERIDVIMIRRIRAFYPKKGIEIFSSRRVSPKELIEAEIQ